MRKLAQFSFLQTSFSFVTTYRRTLNVLGILKYTKRLDQSGPEALCSHPSARHSDAAALKITG